MITTCGLDHASFANATRDFCPPDRNLSGRRASCPDISNPPRNVRISCQGHQGCTNEKKKGVIDPERESSRCGFGIRMGKFPRGSLSLFGQTTMHAALGNAGSIRVPTRRRGGQDPRRAKTAVEPRRGEQRCTRHSIDRTCFHSRMALPIQHETQGTTSIKLASINTVPDIRGSI